jgi:GDP-mannose 4,6-dehydratase
MKKIDRKFNKCLITGITGSGGSYLAEKINKISPKTKIYGTFRSVGFKKILQSNIKNLKLEKVDLKNFKKLKKVIKRINPDLIFHFASNADVRSSFDDPLEFSTNNNSITINLLEAIKQTKKNPLIVICSSSEVYGKVSRKDIPLTEKQKFNPVNPYAATKAFQDFISQIYMNSFNLNIIITRMFSYTNARRKNLFQTAFANQIIEIERKEKKILKHGNLNSVRTFIDIDDAMEAYWLTATRGKIREIYNIGGDKIISVKNFLKELCLVSKEKIICKVDKNLLRPTDVTLQITNSKKFRKHTGWKPKIKFNESVIKLLKECKKLKDTGY